MAADTFYGYAERSANSYVNWDKIGTDLSDTLAEAARLRTEKKDALDAANAETIKTINTAPYGNDVNVNEFTHNLAANTTEQSLLNLRLLKAGKRSPKDFMIVNQNMRDSVNDLYGTIKDYNANFDETMKRNNENVSNEIEPWARAQIEPYANLQDHGAIVNPVNGIVTIGKMVAGPDGVKRLDPNPNTYMTASDMRNFVRLKIDRFQTDVQAKSLVDAMGAEVYAVKSLGKPTETGTIETITNILNRDKARLNASDAKIIQTFEDAETKAINSKLVNPYDRMSVLKSNVQRNPETGELYYFERDPKIAAKNPNAILLVTDLNTKFPTPQLTDEQSKVATEWMRTRMRMMYDYKEETKVVNAIPAERRNQWEIMHGEDQKKATEAANMMGYLYSPENQGQLDAAKQYFMGLNPNITGFKRDKDGITVSYADKPNDFITFSNSDGQPMTKEMFIKSGTALTGNADINSALKNGSYNGGGAFNPNLSTEGSRTIVPKVTLGEQYAKVVDQTPIMVNEGGVAKAFNAAAKTPNDRDFANELNKKFGKFGITAVATTSRLNPNQIIQLQAQGSKDGSKITSPEIDLSDPKDQVEKQIRDFVKAHVPGKNELEKAATLKSYKDKGFLDSAQENNKSTAPGDNIFK
jgi:hypothetical protein